MSLRLFVRGQDLEPLGEITDYVSFEITLRNNKPDVWILKIAQTSAAFPLLTFGNGLIVELEDVIISSGPVGRVERTIDARADTLIVSGFDDSIHFEHRLLYPVLPTAFIDVDKNILSYGQATFEENTSSATGWGAAFNCSIALGGFGTTIAPDVKPTHGHRFLVMTASAAGDAGAGTPAGTSGIPVVAGSDYVLRIQHYAESVSRGAFVDINWYNSVGTYISTTAVGAYTQSLRQWTDLSALGTAPGGAAYAACLYRVISAGAGERTFLDRALFSRDWPFDWFPPDYIPYNEIGNDVGGIADASVTVALAYLVDRNIGASAAPRRKVQYVRSPTAIPSDVPDFGPTGEYQWRFEPLGDLMRKIADVGGVNFRLAFEHPQLVLRIWQPTDRTDSVWFSLDSGNISRLVYAEEFPEGNYITIGGGGDGVQRIFREHDDKSSIAKYGTIEKFLDGRTLPTVNDLDREAQNYLSTYASPLEFSVTTRFIEQGPQFPTDYRIGDLVTVVIDGSPVTGTIQEVKITSTAEDPLNIVAAIDGTVSRTNIFDRLRRATTRVLNLEGI